MPQLRFGTLEKAQSCILFTGMKAHQQQPLSALMEIILQLEERIQLCNFGSQTSMLIEERSSKESNLRLMISKMLLLIRKAPQMQEK